jgi:hypothetical protein
MARETNDEARMTNNETNPNEQIVGRLCHPERFRDSQNGAGRHRDIDGQAGSQARRERASEKPYKCFDLRHSFDIRHLDFVIKKIRVYSCAFVVNH